MVDNPGTDKAAFNQKKFQDTVELGVRALDELLDIGYDSQPLDENRVTIDDWRSIGLGIIGLADMFIALGIKYGSHESADFAGGIAKILSQTAFMTSSALAKEKGPFKKFNWNYIEKSQLVSQLPEYLRAHIKKYGLRNGSLLSVAPSGSLALLLGVSPGAEPIYEVRYKRTTHKMEKEGSKTFEVYVKSVNNLVSLGGSGKEPYIIESHDITPLDRIMVQGAMQKYIDNAISSTINMKNEATVDDVFNTYRAAWQYGCKGITIFRDGCARTSILGKEKKEEVKGEQTSNTPSIVFDSIKPGKRRDVKKIIGYTLVRRTACVKSMYLTINIQNGEIFEVFSNASTGCKSNIGNLTRLVSLALRSGIKVSSIIEELGETACPACQVLRQQGQKDISTSCGGALASAISEVYKELKESTSTSGNYQLESENYYLFQETVAENYKVSKNEVEKKDSGLLACPACGELSLIPEGKCATCRSCGWSKCN